MAQRNNMEFQRPYAGSYYLLLTAMERSRDEAARIGLDKVLLKFFEYTSRSRFVLFDYKYLKFSDNPVSAEQVRSAIETSRRDNTFPVLDVFTHSFVRVSVDCLENYIRDLKFSDEQRSELRSILIATQQEYMTTLLLEKEYGKFPTPEQIMGSIFAQNQTGIHAAQRVHGPVGIEKGFAFDIPQVARCRIGRIAQDLSQCVLLYAALNGCFSAC